MKKLKVLDKFMLASECAKLAGIEVATFTAYVNRDQGPQPVLFVAGRRMYDRTEVEAWVADRVARRAAGQGRGMRNVN